MSQNVIDGEKFQKMVASAANSLDTEKTEINNLNVFPVPDGDTGINMSLTLSAIRELSRFDGSISDCADKASNFILRAARGNSGAILSLFFRGIAKAWKEVENADCEEVIAGFKRGVSEAYKAVMKPAEGTILTVARLSAAKATQAAQENNYFEYVHAAAIEEAKAALANTINQNPVLKKAGVVDAGGKGWLVALEAMFSSLQGNDVIVPEGVAGAEVKESANFDDFDTDDITFTYCTEFIIQRENDLDPEKLRDFLSSLGDSLVLVDDEEIIKVHVHTNDPGKALHEAIDYGSFVTVKIENMRLQHTEKVMSEQELAPQIAEPEKALGVVSVCAGEGLADVFMNLGVDQIISGGQTMNPSTQDILEAVNKVPAETVYVLPNNKNIIMAAQQVEGLTPKHVVVIQSKSVPQDVFLALQTDNILL